MIPYFAIWRRWSLIGAIVILEGLSGLSAVSAQQDQGRIARDLSSSVAEERRGALEAAAAIRPAARSASLQAALLGALREEVKKERIRVRLAENGSKVPDAEDPEFIHRAAEVVGELPPSPQGAEVLASALDYGMGVAHSLTKMGDMAVAPIAAVAADTGSSVLGIANSLITLRMLVESQNTRPLSQASFGSISKVAAQRLSAPGPFAEAGHTLIYAIDLAIALGDSTLLAVVKSIATNDAELTRRGVVDPARIRLVKQHAQQRLAGAPARPPKQ